MVPGGMITKEVVRKWGDILGGYVGVSEGERGGGDRDGGFGIGWGGGR